MGENEAAVTDITSEAAQRAQQVAGLRQGGVDDAIAQVRSLGRNRPGLFLLGAFGVGLVAGRVRNLADPNEGNGSGYRSAQAYDSGYTPGTAGYGNAGYDRRTTPTSTTPPVCRRPTRPTPRTAPRRRPTTRRAPPPSASNGGAPDGVHGHAGVRVRGDPGTPDRSRVPGRPGEAGRSRRLVG